jgi:uncharacterized protein
MPHLRVRYLTDIIEKRLKFFPVVAIQGARQVGKSAMVRELLPQRLKHFHYETLDQPSILDFAKSSPESFLESKKSRHGTLAIDEAQKVPAIFDAIKYFVDKERIPGQFMLLGSTEFSKRTLIRESLTGRMAMLRLFPFTLSEAAQLPTAVSDSALTLHKVSRVKRDALMKHLDHGGMPGAFHIRDEATRDVFFKEWIGLVILRDLMMIPRVKLDPKLAEDILRNIALIPEPTIGNIARNLSVNPRRIKMHVECLEALFVLHKIEPHSLGSGQPMYFHCDVGLANFFGASFERRLQTWIYQELLSNSQLRTDVHEKIYFYRTLKGSMLHFIVEQKKVRSVIKIIAKESSNQLDIKLLESFKKKHQDKETILIALGSTTRKFKEQDVTMMPWEAIV